MKRKKPKTKVDRLKILETVIIVIATVLVIFCLYMAWYSYMYQHTTAYFNAVYDAIDAATKHLFVSMGLG